LNPYNLCSLILFPFLLLVTISIPYPYSLMARLYINLPVENLQTSISFYQALGFVQNLDFSDEKAAAMTLDDSLSVMLLSKDFFGRFVPAGKTIADSHTTTEVLNALELDSREAVDAILDQAISA
jgi:uncharacterized protein